MGRHDLTRLDLVVNVRFPGARAHSIQVAAMAEALADTGLNVDVVVPRRFPYRDMDPWAHYGVRRTFAVQRIANIDTIDMVGPRAQRLPFLVQSVTFGLRALARAAVEREAGLLVRDHYTLQILVAGLRGPDLLRLSAEVHNLPAPGGRRQRVARALAKLPALITISDALKEDLEREGVDGSRILVARDGVHLHRYVDLVGQAEARRQLHLDPDRPIVVYAGQFYPWKGVDRLIEAAEQVPDVQLVLVGGDQHNNPRIAKLVERHAPGRVVRAGIVPHMHVPLFLSAADIVALPNSAREEISARYTSPLKLFEAMAARRPIVASDLPSLKEVLTHDRNALLVEPDNAEAIAAGIDALLDDEARGARLAEQAWVDVQPYAWAERGRRVADFLRDRLAVGMS